MVLARIDRIATTCQDESEAVVKKYVHVIEIINEISEASYVKQGKTEEAKDLAARNAQIARDSKTLLEEQKKAYKRQLDKLEKYEKESRKALKKAIDDVPDGWDMIGMKVCNGLAEGLTQLVSTVTNPATFG